MKKVIRPFLYTLTFILALAFLGKPTFALVPLIKPEIKIDPKVVGCAIIFNNINKKIDNFEDANSKHLATYTKLQDRLGLMLEKWAGWDYDTEKLENDLKTLDEKISEYNDDYSDLISKLETLKNSCGEDSYADKLVEAKASLKELRQDVVDIRVFYQTEVRKNIIALKAQNL